MADEMALAFERARDADYWWLDVEFGSDISLLDEGRFTLAARHFNTLVYFLPPDDENATWRLAVEEVAEENEDGIELGNLTVAEVIDIVPYAAEDWVLAATREASEYRLEADDAAERQAGMRLHGEWEQGEAHSARWKRKSEARYGDILLYEFSEDAQLSYERGEENGRPALFIGESDYPSDRVLVAPDTEHPWRWSESGRVEQYGERLTVREALDRAGDDHAEWVREHTAYALGDTLTALRAIQDQALTGRDPETLQELARLAGHAQQLADGLKKPLVDDGS